MCGASLEQEGWWHVGRGLQRRTVLNNLAWMKRARAQKEAASWVSLIEAETSWEEGWEEEKGSSHVFPSTKLSPGNGGSVLMWERSI